MEKVREVLTSSHVDGSVEWVELKLEMWMM